MVVEEFAVERRVHVVGKREADAVHRVEKRVALPLVGRNLSLISGACTSMFSATSSSTAPTQSCSTCFFFAIPTESP